MIVLVQEGTSNTCSLNLGQGPTGFVRVGFNSSAGGPINPGNSGINSAAHGPTEINSSKSGSVVVGSSGISSGPKNTCSAAVIKETVQGGNALAAGSATHGPDVYVQENMEQNNSNLGQSNAINLGQATPNTSCGLNTEVASIPLNSSTSLKYLETQRSSSESALLRIKRLRSGSRNLDGLLSPGVLMIRCWNGTWRHLGSRMMMRMIGGMSFGYGEVCRRHLGPVGHHGSRGRRKFRRPRSQLRCYYHL